MRMRKYIAIVAFAITAFGIFGNSAHAKIIYVAQYGNDEKASGTARAPYKTINKAVNSTVNPGDEIVVRDGTYNESVFIPKHKSGLPGRYVTLRSENPRGAKIVGVKWHSIMTFANYVRIDGFDAVGGISGHSVHHVEVLNNVVHDSLGAGIYFGKSEFLLIDRNVTYGNTANDVSSGISIHIPQNVSGDTTTRGFRVIVRNNISYNNMTITGGHTDGNGIIFDDWLLRKWIVREGQYPPDLKPYRYPAVIENNLVYNNGGGGIVVFATDNITVRNNTAYHNSKDPLAKGQWRAELKNMSASNNKWINNIAVADPIGTAYAVALGNFSHNDWGTNQNVIWEHNLTYNGVAGDPSLMISGENAVPAGAGNKFGVDPEFIRARKNFRLRLTSPALDAGTLKYGSSEISLGGARRVVKTIDIGAYEKPLFAYKQ